jgi:hypothetical protein
MLEKLQPSVQAMVAAITTVEGSPTTVAVSQLSAQADSLLVALASLPQLDQNDDSAAMVVQLSEFTTTVRDVLASVRQEVADLGSNVEAVKSALGEADTAREVLQQATQERVDALGAAIDQQQDRVTLALDDFAARTTSLLEQLQTTFTTAELERSTSASNAAREAVEDIRTTGETAIAGFKTKATAAVDELMNLRDEAGRLVGVVTGTATAGYFKKVADQEKASADVWRKISVGFAILVSCVGAWVAIAAHRDEDLTVARVMAKALLSVSLGVIAAYAAKQSGNHRRAERRARHRELQLAAIGPFLEPLDDAQRAEIRKQFGESLFASEPDDGGVHDHEVRLSNSTMDALATLVKIRK